MGHKDIEIISGDGSNLDFSPVSNHIDEMGKSRPKDSAHEIIIPETNNAKDAKKKKRKKK